MPRAPRRPSSGSSSSNPSQTKRTFLLALTALGAFIVGRSSHSQWSQSDYLKGISTWDSVMFSYATMNGTLNQAVSVLDSYTSLGGEKEAPRLLADAPLYINDKTMRLSPYVDRVWLHNGHHLPKDAEKPKIKVILTELGWNQPDEEEGLKYVRSLRSREFMQAVIDHPYFDPTFSWTDMMEGKVEVDPDIQYIVFFDVETCFETNYPKYTGWFFSNADYAGNRTATLPNFNQCFDINGCPPIKQTLNSPLFRQVASARAIYLDCRCFGPSNYRQHDPHPQLSIASISAEPRQLLPSSDMGLPPPSLNPVRLSHKERHQIMSTCEQEEERPYLFTCIGNVRNDIRQNLLTLHDEADGVLLMLPTEFEAQFAGKTTYTKVMKDSLFSATPRGDCHFSYRFTEVMSSGAIPVIHADGWVLPFRRDLIDWGEECAIVIPEAKVFDTVNILKKITPEERCRRRKRCYEIYTKYLANAEGQIAGVVETAIGITQDHNASLATKRRALRRKR